MDARPRQRPHHQPDQRRIDVAGEDVGRALVVRPEQEALDLRRLGAVEDAEHVERHGAPQLADEAVELVLGQLIGDAGRHQAARERGDIGRVLRHRHRAGHAQEQHGGRIPWRPGAEHREVVLGADRAGRAGAGRRGSVPSSTSSGASPARRSAARSRSANGALDCEETIGSAFSTRAGMRSSAGSLLPTSMMTLVGFGSSRISACKWRSVTVKPKTCSRAAGCGRVDPDQHRENQLRRSSAFRRRGPSAEARKARSRARSAGL